MARIYQIKSHLIVITDVMQSLVYQMFSEGDGWVYMLSHKQKPLVAARGGVHFQINLKEVK